ncbi:MAG TPA: methyltransferase, partial [Pyrinomonadaceae bacterium]|nr:methyltransferase [Pyrinomonadaceae bacterium]
MSTTIREVESTPMTEVSEQSPKGAPEAAPPEAVLTQLITGSLGSQAVYVAAQLGIADLLVDGPKSVDELAQAAGVDGPSLYRVLRALASFGVFTELHDQVFGLTPTAELLRSDSPRSLRDLAIFMGEDWHWQVWGRTLYSVRTGKAAWAEVHGQEVFPYFAGNPEAAKIFDRAMTSLSNLAIKAVVEAYDFSDIETLMDVAGGHGRLLATILEANASVKGVLFDQAHVLEGAKDSEQIRGLGERCELVSGDFFVSVPAGADGYIMKHIIHDWDDDRALQILNNIRKVMKDDGRVMLVEAVISDTNQPDFGKLLDIEMLVSPGGKERTAAEYKDLFARAGLRLTRIVPTKSPYSVIEA